MLDTYSRSSKGPLALAGGTPNLLVRDLSLMLPYPTFSDGLGVGLICLVSMTLTSSPFPKLPSSFVGLFLSCVFFTPIGSSFIFKFGSSFLSPGTFLFPLKFLTPSSSSSTTFLSLGAPNPAISSSRSPRILWSMVTLAVGFFLFLMTSRSWLSLL